MFHVALAARAASEAHEVRHVAAADQQSAAAGGKPDQLRDPSHGLGFDFGRERRQAPRAHVLIQRRRQKVAEHADRRRARGDVAEEPRVPVEQASDRTATR